nr:AAA family ATPase [Natronorubrum bangense]
MLVGVLSKQHALIQDVPGTGKTLTARSIADTVGLEFNRIQFTPDMLPADITGSNVYDERNRDFEFAKGPIFSNIILAEDLNRAPPKTQSALLEAMQQKEVSVGGETIQLPEPFFVLATQNPIEEEGTFPLPTSQLDRFTLKTEMGYPDRTGDREIIDRRLSRMVSTPTVDQILEPETVIQLQEMPEFVHVDEKIREYVVDIVRTTRGHNAVDVGVSPRGMQRFLEAVRARAVIRGRDFVIPDDVKLLAGPTLSHRLVLDSAALVEQTTREAVIQDVLDQIEVPAMNEL